MDTAFTILAINYHCRAAVTGIAFDQTHTKTCTRGLRVIFREAFPLIPDGKLGMVAGMLDDNVDGAFAVLEGVGDQLGHH